MNSKHTTIKDITTSNKRSLLGCFEKGNKYHRNESRNSCHDATYTRLNAREESMNRYLLPRYHWKDVVDTN